MFQHLAEDAENEYAMIDATIARAHQHSAGDLRRGARDRSDWLQQTDLNTEELAHDEMA
jgi:hypothetical protein